MNHYDFPDAPAGEKSAAEAAPTAAAPSGEKPAAKARKAPAAASRAGGKRAPRAVAAKAAAAKPAASATKPVPAKKVIRKVAADKAVAADKIAKAKEAPAVSKAPQGQVEAGKPDKKAVKRRARLVRDSFTMPEADFELIAMLKSKALDARRAAKKSELLRAGLRLLARLEAQALVAALDKLEPVKIGRPKKGH
jgi:uncharacterized protein YjhX (UPF0386 family)